MLNSAEWAPVIFVKYSCLTNVLNKKIALVRNFTVMLAFYQTIANGKLYGHSCY